MFNELSCAKYLSLKLLYFNFHTKPEFATQYQIRLIYTWKRAIFSSYFLSPKYFSNRKRFVFKSSQFVYHNLNLTEWWQQSSAFQPVGDHSSLACRSPQPFPSLTSKYFKYWFQSCSNLCISRSFRSCSRSSLCFMSCFNSCYCSSFNSCSSSRSIFSTLLSHTSISILWCSFCFSSSSSSNVILYIIYFTNDV